MTKKYKMMTWNQVVYTRNSYKTFKDALGFFIESI